MLLYGIATFVFASALFASDLFDSQTASQLAQVNAAAGNNDMCTAGNYGCKFGTPPPKGQKGPCMKEKPCDAKVVKGKKGTVKAVCVDVKNCKGTGVEDNGKGDMPKLPEPPKGGDPAQQPQPCTSEADKQDKTKCPEAPGSSLLNQILNPASAMVDTARKLGESAVSTIDDVFRSLTQEPAIPTPTENIQYDASKVPSASDQARITSQPVVEPKTAVSHEERVGTPPPLEAATGFTSDTIDAMTPQQRTETWFNLENMKNEFLEALRSWRFW